MDAKLTFLGTGSSLGVPIIGCKCKVCTSPDFKNKRLRAGAFLELGDKRFLIDAGPDIRTQALRHEINQVDGFILTHSHNDHIAGLDDIKVYKHIKDKKLSCLMLAETFEELKVKYHYFLKPTEKDPENSPFFSWNILKGGFGNTVFEGISIGFVTYLQSGMKVLGIKVGDLAYISDIKDYSEEIFERLKGVKILVISALRAEGSAMHFSVEEAINFGKRVGAKTTYLTHISHEMDHEKMQASLPSDVVLAYDGFCFSFHMDDL
jgi:phosphoribosyl 1,2-cyclic phosphate phosphodiesterase